jgi:hypothetical protein
MNRRELNLAIFEGTAKKVLWQPRLETWIIDRMEHGTMPDRFKGMNNLEIYDALGCSIRYGASTGLEWFSTADDVVRSEEKQPEHTIYRIKTPIGELKTVYRDIWEGGKQVNHRIEEFPVKTVENLQALTYIVNHDQFRANVETFNNAAKAVGNRAEPSMIIASSGFTDLIKHHCGLLETYYLLTDYPAEFEAYMEACDRRDDRMIDAVLQLPCKIFNFGDHATNEFTPPPILKKYLVPRWQRLSAKLQKNGRFTHSHWDGNSRTIIPFLMESGLNGVEALTPAPMCDMTLEEIKHAVGDKLVTLDLIRTIDFLPNFPMNELLDVVRKTIDMFAPKLILGVSDEISQVGQIEKIEAISKLIDKEYGGLAD